MIKRISAFVVSFALICPAPAAAQALRAVVAEAPVLRSAISPSIGSNVTYLQPAALSLSKPALVSASGALQPSAVSAAPIAAPVPVIAQATILVSGLQATKAPGVLLDASFDGTKLAAAAANDDRFSVPVAAQPVPERPSMLRRASAYAATAMTVAAPAVHHSGAISNGMGFAILGASIVGLLLLTRWIESSKAVQFYLARRRWVTANFRKWKEAEPQEKAEVEAEADRIIAANKAGRVNSWSDLWKALTFRRKKAQPETPAIEPVKPAPAKPDGFTTLGLDTPRPAKKAKEGPKVITFADVAGQEEAKAELVKVVEYIKNPEAYNRLGAKGYKGVLLFGPPGTGKTLIARAVAGEAGATWHETSGSSFVNVYVGKGPSNVRAAFAKARGDGKKPGVLFIDEIDAVGKKRGNGDGNEEYENTLNALLTEMSAPENSNVVVIAATNRPDLLDPALTRGRRLGLKVPVGLPDIDGREAILKLHAQGMPLEEGVTLRRFAELTPRLSGADLEEIVNDAAMLAAERKATAVGEIDFRRAVERATIGHERKLVMTDYEKKVVAHHESGHALVAWLVPNGDQIRKITIVPHGLQALGLVQTLEADEKYMYSKPWLEDRIAIALGGRVAEKMATGQVFSGAQNDFEQATRLARMMVMKFGMSDAIGHVSYDMDGERPNVGRPMSEKQRELIDAEVKRIIDEQSARVEKLLAENKRYLEGMAAELMVKETLREGDLDRLLPARPNK